MKHRIMTRTVTNDHAADQDRSDTTCAPADWWSPPTSGTLSNVFTVDLEDWPIAVLGPEYVVSERVVENTKRVLQLLAWHGVKATFFVLTRVAERFPELIREIHAAGHEIASHGHGHERLNGISPRRFRDDVTRSIEILRDITGERPIGYRAPAFSLVASTLWAVPILDELGFKYSSSVFPIRHPRYGIPAAPRRIHHWPNARLIECPPATVRFLGRNWPIAGGGYFRLLPGGLVRGLVRQMNQRHEPAILYLHPYELDPGGTAYHVAEGAVVGPWRRLTQEMFRTKVEWRLHRLLESFCFTTMKELLRHAV